MNKRRKGAQRLFDGNIGLIYPDFISKNATNRIIADAKYKPLGNIGNKDYLQVLIRHIFYIIHIFPAYQFPPFILVS